LLQACHAVALFQELTVNLANASFVLPEPSLNVRELDGDLVLPLPGIGHIVAAVPDVDAALHGGELPVEAFELGPGDLRLARRGGLRRTRLLDLARSDEPAFSELRATLPAARYGTGEFRLVPWARCANPIVAIPSSPGFT
jgi:hypothetical protein